MKKIIETILSAVMITAAIPAIAADNEIKVFVDGEQLQFEVQPQIINDCTMVPMRTIFERLGYTVTWNSEYQTVVAVNKDLDREIMLMIGNTAIIYYSVSESQMRPNTQEAISEFIDNNAYRMDTAPLIMDGSTLVPIRAVSEASGCTVIWDGNKRSVNIFTEKLIPVPITASIPAAEPTDEPETVTEAPAYKYFHNTDLIDYGAFNDVTCITSRYGYHYRYNMDDINDYMAAIKDDGWICTKANKKIEDYILTKDEQHARILWDKTAGAVIITNEEYIDTLYSTVINKSFERMETLVEYEKTDDNKKSYNDMDAILEYVADYYSEHLAAMIINKGGKPLYDSLTIDRFKQNYTKRLKNLYGKTNEELEIICENAFKFAQDEYYMRINRLGVSTSTASGSQLADVCDAAEKMYLLKLCEAK